MRTPKIVFAASAAIVSSAFMLTSASAAHVPCKVLTAQAFGKIMGYSASVMPASTATNCFYKGPGNSFGQFTILTEAASGPQADAFLHRRGSQPPPSSGLIGGTFREGSVIFSISLKSNDRTKLQALVAEIKRNLK